MEKESEYYNTTYPALNGDEFGTIDGDNDTDVEIRRTNSRETNSSSTDGSVKSDSPRKSTPTKRKVPSMYDEDMYSLPNTNEEAISKSATKKIDPMPETKETRSSSKLTSSKRPFCCIALVCTILIAIGGSAGISYYFGGQNVILDGKGCTISCFICERLEDNLR